MIPSPNLDDRTFQDIVDEAIRLIPHYCPEWTNHNPTDPGVTLIELFAWMTEMMIYRLNKVPDKTYLTLLDLVGLSIVPPQPSRTLLSFMPVEGYDGNIFVKRGTQVSTIKSKDHEPVVFETEKDIAVTNINLDSCFGTFQGKITENNISFNEEEIKSFSLFSGQAHIDRYLYIGDTTLEFLQDNNTINISFVAANNIKTVNDEIINFLKWEFWNGKKWIPVEDEKSLPGVKKKDNEIYLSGPLDIEETEVNGNSGFYIRAALDSVPPSLKCLELYEISSKLLFRGEGLAPDKCFANTENMVYHTIDLNKDFQPFVELPKYNDAFYIASDDAFSKIDSEIIINFYLSDSESLDKPEPNEDLILMYEYWNGKNWIDIGSTTSKGVSYPKGDYNFTDTTNCFSNTGQVKFLLPSDIKIKEVNNQEHYWIRIRITAGDFGSGGNYSLDEAGKWSWSFDKVTKPPMFSQIKIRFNSDNKPFENVISYYDYNFNNFSKIIKKNFIEKDKEDESKIKFFKIFEINKEESAITYFGFNKKLPDGENNIYFKLDEKGKVKPAKYHLFRSSKLGIDIKKKKRLTHLRWEYWDGKNWKTMSVNDYTDNFHESGFIEFRTPSDIKNKKEFGRDMHWLRLVFESGSFEMEPKISNILLNSVYAFNSHTYKNELLGSSNGTPSQEFYLLHAPVLPDIELIVRENEIPPLNERDVINEEEGEDAIIVKKNEEGKDDVWIRYHQVENFYASKPYSRHYCVDYTKNKIIFGNGYNGAIPPRLKNNIRIAKYRTGGGVSGNVGANTITVLRENIPYISDVINHYSAEGGSDLEDLERLKERANYIFKNLNRAVTAEDYEWLACEASTSVARAKCLSKCGKNGEVILIIIPKPDATDFSLEEKLLPTTELLRRVKEYLDSRKLVGTKVRTEAPSYKEVNINLKLVFKKNIAEVQLLKERVELSIRRFLHPITGGAEGKGWPFNKHLTKNEIFNVLEKMDGIYYIEEINMIDKNLNVEVEKLILEEDDLIHLNKLEIIERKHQY